MLFIFSNIGIDCFILYVNFEKGKSLREVQRLSPHDELGEY